MHTRLLHVMYLYFNVQFYCLFIVTQQQLYVDFSREFHHFVLFERIFKGLNWFYYILSKVADLRCQQVIFSKSQVMDSKSKSSPKSMREVASQVTSHKNDNSSPSHLTRVYISDLLHFKLYCDTAVRSAVTSQSLCSEYSAATQKAMQC